jgi:transposase
MHRRLSESLFHEQSTIIVSLHPFEEAVEFATPLLINLITKVMEKIQKNGTVSGIPVINFHAAGIDVGSTLTVVSFTDPSGVQSVYETGCFTKDLKEPVQLLKEQKITDAAMEATGIYWMSLYGLLEEAGIRVTLINPAHYKNSANQKNDVNDSIWIHQYHSCGILRHSHIADEHCRELRHYIHERTVIQNQKRDTLNRMHRLLELMNVKFQHLISDIEGVGGMKLLRAIASGVSDAEKLVGCLNLNLFKAKREELGASLEGVYEKQFVTLLKMKLEEYDFFVDRMKQYELLIDEALEKMPRWKVPEEEKEEEDPQKQQKFKYVRKNQYHMDVRAQLIRITGIDLTLVNGFQEKMLPDVISVTGTDMSKWPTAQHFASYLKLSPRKKISGGKFLGHERNKTTNPATQAFRLAAQSISQGKSSMSALYRRLAIRKGPKTANKAVARKLAVLFYTLLKNHQEYDMDRYNQTQQKREKYEMKRLKRLAHKLGYEIQKRGSE